MLKFDMTEITDMLSTDKNTQLPPAPVAEHTPTEHAGFVVWQDDNEHGWWNYKVRAHDHPHGGFETEEAAIREAKKDVSNPAPQFFFDECGINGPRLNDPDRPGERIATFTMYAMAHKYGKQFERALSAYDRDQQTIRELTEALEAVIALTREKDILKIAETAIAKAKGA